MQSSSPRPSFSATARDILKLDWSQSTARAALRCLPGFVIVLLLGLGTHHLGDSAAAAVAAMSVGFGSFQRVGKSRTRAMLFASVAISFAALTGSLASRSLPGVAAVIGGWAFAYGLLTAWEAGLTWIGLQCVIVSVVTSGSPVPLEQAFVRAGLTLAGGLLQTGLITGIWALLGPPGEPVGGSPVSMNVEPAQGFSLSHLRLHWSTRSPVGRYAYQLAFTLILATAIDQALHLPNGYWVPLTAVIVLKPEFHHTYTRGIARILGTILGAGLATLLAATLRPEPGALCALIIFFAWCSYALVRVNYGLFVICITAYVAFLLSLLGLPELQVVANRMINTILGGAISLLAYLIPFPDSDDKSEGSAEGEHSSD